MSRKKLTIGDNLEFLESAKLRKKYESLGYVYHEQYKRGFEGKNFVLDAYAIHPITKEEIIFEIKSYENWKSGDNERLAKVRETYRELFPKAKFIVVLAREIEVPKIQLFEIDLILLLVIEDNYLKNLRNVIPNFSRLDRVDSITYTHLVADFDKTELKGFANLKFWLNTENIDFIGESLSDGIPFYFELVSLNHGNWLEPHLSLSSKNKIQFDFSEFNILE